MRILVVSPRFPWPLDKADSMTVYHFLEFFSQRHEIDLLAFGEHGFGHAFKREYVSHVRSFCRRIEVVPLRKAATCIQCTRSLLSSDPLQVWYYRRKAMHEALHRMIEFGDYDLVYTHLLRMAQYTRHLENQRKVLAMQISLALEYRRLAEQQENIRNPLKCWLYRLEAKKLRTYEASATRLFDRTLVIGETDRSEIVANGGAGSSLYLNPHGVDLPSGEAQANDRIPDSIVFAGNMSNDPNIDAATWFSRSILPRIGQRIPNVRFFILGSSPPKRVRKLQSDSRIVVTGYVENLDAWISRCLVAVDPMRIGAGLQNKILEAMALKLPVVATSVANEGICAKHGDEILIADDEEEFADRVVALLQDQSLRDSLARAGHRMVHERFTWEHHYADLEAEFLRIAAGTA